MRKSTPPAIQSLHRLICQVPDDIKTVKIIRIGTHPE
jgi:mRNA-degrading endonuclease RelE of RelBE toxin-antitoxin system